MSKYYKTFVEFKCLENKLNFNWDDMEFFLFILKKTDILTTYINRIRNIKNKVLSETSNLSSIFLNSASETL